MVKATIFPGPTTKLPRIGYQVCTYSPHKASQSGRNPSKCAALSADRGCAKQKRERGEREGGRETATDEAASITDGVGSVDPSCTIVHFVRVLSLFLSQSSTQSPSKHTPKSTYLFNCSEAKSRRNVPTVGCLFRGPPAGPPHQPGGAGVSASLRAVSASPK